MNCQHCGRSFVPSKFGHMYCKPLCRHRGWRPPEERVPLDQSQVDRLFSADRDPRSLCRPDDWMPMGGQENEEAFLELDGYATVGARRRLFGLHLVD